VVLHLGDGGATTGERQGRAFQLARTLCHLELLVRVVDVLVAEAGCVGGAVLAGAVTALDDNRAAVGDLLNEGGRCHENHFLLLLG
jgi:hypothetical protein